VIDIEQIITEVIDREGRRYTNHPADRGGPTKFGITLKALARYRGEAVTAADVAALQEPEARDVYRANYLVAPGFVKIHDPYVMVLAFDCGVNHGTDRATRWLQELSGAAVDGKFGPRTELAVNTFDPVRLYQRLLARRIRFFGQVINRDPERVRATKAGYKLQAAFAEGWLDRAAGFVETP